MTITEYLNKLYTYLGGSQEDLSLQIEEKPERIEVSLELPEEEVSLFIGSHGETLEAFETLLRSVFRDEYEDKKIIVDINGYIARKEQKLKENALEIAYQVLDTGRPYVYGYLNSYERYLIHSAIAEDPELEELETFSEDEESGRVLVIQLKEENHDSFDEDEEDDISGEEELDEDEEDDISGEEELDEDDFEDEDDNENENEE